MSGERDALVIGGGFAGVAAAVALRARGLSVAILDDRATLGGRARSDVLGGVTIDTGAQLAATSFARTMRLLARDGEAPHAEGGATPALRIAPGRDVLVRGEERHPIQFGSLRSLLAFGALGASEKMKLGAQLVPLIARHRRTLDAAATEIPPELDRESARAFMERAVGPRAADALVETAFNSFYAATGAELSLAFYLTLGRYGSDSDLLAAAGGWSALLARALAGDPPVAHEPRARIAALDASAEGVRAWAEDGRCWRARGAVVATGARAARALLGPNLDAGAPLIAWLDAVELRPTWTLAVALDRAPDRSIFGVLQHPAQASAVAGCAVHGAKLGPLAPRDVDVVLAWPTPETARRLHGHAAPEIVAAMMPDVERLVPAVRGHVTHVRLYRVEGGTPLARPGFVAERARGRALADELPGTLARPLALAGDYLATPTIEGAVASGEHAAAALAARLAVEGG